MGESSEQHLEIPGGISSTQADKCESTTRANDEQPKNISEERPFRLNSFAPAAARA
jgi:hypothetical protein